MAANIDREVVQGVPNLLKGARQMWRTETKPQALVSDWRSPQAVPLIDTSITEAAPGPVRARHKAFQVYTLVAQSNGNNADHGKCAEIWRNKTDF